MPLELQIIRASEFVRMGAHGHFDLAASKAALAGLAAACRKRHIHRALMDLRALRPGPKPVFSTADLVSLVNTFAEAGFTRNHWLAILYQTDPHKRARLFAFLSTLRGFHVQAFSEFEQALYWLSNAPESTPERRLTPGAKVIPVQVKRTDQPIKRTSGARAAHEAEASERLRGRPQSSRAGGRSQR